MASKKTKRKPRGYTPSYTGDPVAKKAAAKRVSKSDASTTVEFGKPKKAVRTKLVKEYDDGMKVYQKGATRIVEFPEDYDYSKLK